MALALLPIILLLNSTANAQAKSDIVIPKFNDEYCNTIKKLEAGKTDIDYAAFRYSFLKSGQYGMKHTMSYDSLKQQLLSAADEHNTSKVISLAKAVLSIDYTSMTGHKYLRQASKIAGDTATARKHHDIQFGLMNSILKTGDAGSCETAWEVTQVEEEYFILKMRGATIKKQSIAQAGKNVCDKMEVTMDDGQEKTYYFKTNRVFAKYPRQ